MSSEIFLIINYDGTETEWVKIDRGNDEFTWMTKSVYDEQQKALKDAAN